MFNQKLGDRNSPFLYHILFIDSVILLKKYDIKFPCLPFY